MTTQVWPNKIVRLPSGPQGPSAGQDLAFVLTGGFAVSELINGPRLQHAATWTTIWVHTTSGVQIDQTITLNLQNADGTPDGATISTVDIALTPGVYDYEIPLPDPGLVAAQGNYPQLIMPAVPDNFLVDLTLTLGSTP